jgi:hypothetical protein
MESETIIKNFMDRLQAERPEAVMKLVSPRGNEPAILFVSPIAFVAGMPKGDDWRFVQLDDKVYLKDAGVLVRVWPKRNVKHSIVLTIMTAISGAAEANLLMDMLEAKGEELRSTRNN